MNNFRNYLSTIAVFAAIVGLLILSMATSKISANEVGQGPNPKEIDLIPVLRDKHLVEGLNLIRTLPTGEKISAKVKGGKIVEWILTDVEGKDHKGEIRKKKMSISNTVTCSATYVTTTTDLKTGKSTSTSFTVQIPCPDDVEQLGSDNAGANTGSNSNSNSNTKKP
jgi:hypothetical protein